MSVSRKRLDLPRYLIGTPTITSSDGESRIEAIDWSWRQSPVDMKAFPSGISGRLSAARTSLNRTGIRHIRPGGRFGMLMTQGLVWCAAAALLASTWGHAIAWICAYLVVRMCAGYVVGVWGLRDPVLRKKLWLLPLHDFFLFFVWLVSFVGE